MTATPEPEPMSKGTVGWGILATGGIARLFARDLVAHGHRIAAVGSRSPATAQRFADEFGIPRAYGTYEELVADPDVDVVYVATPHNLHAANARAALAGGKHVLVEKAFTLNAAEARSVVELARDRGLVSLEAMWTRFLPHMRFVRDVIASGRIGQVVAVRAEHAQRLPPDPTHRLNDPHLGGGALLDVGVYPVSFTLDILGPPTQITARGTLGETGVDVSVATIFSHGDGAESTSYSSMRTPGQNTAVVLGTEGRIEIGRVWFTSVPVTVHDADNHLVDRYDVPVSGRGMQYQAAEVERLLAAGETVSPLMTPEGTIAVMETMDEIRAQLGVRYPGE